MRVFEILSEKYRLTTDVTGDLTLSLSAKGDFSPLCLLRLPLNPILLLGMIYILLGHAGHLSSARWVNCQNAGPSGYSATTLLCVLSLVFQCCQGERKDSGRVDAFSSLHFPAPACIRTGLGHSFAHM